MSISATNRGTAEDQNTISPATDCSVGLVILAIATANSGTGGTNPITSVTDTDSNTWTLIFTNTQSPGGVASDGVTMSIYSTNQNSGNTLTTGTTITVNGATATTYLTLTNIFSNVFNPINSINSGSNKGSGTAPTITSSSITSGNIILGITAKFGSTLTGDSDTTNGSWSANQADSLTKINTQTKLTNTTGTQTYNTSWTTSRQYVIGWVELQEVFPGGSFDPMGIMGVFGI